MFLYQWNWILQHWHYFAVHILIYLPPPQSFMFAIVQWTQFYNFSKFTCKNELNIILNIGKWFQISSLQFMSVEHHCNPVQFSGTIGVRVQKQGRMWDVNVHMLCRMYFVTKHKRQIHLCLKSPQLLWKKPPICWLCILLYMDTNITQEHAAFIQSWRVEHKPDTHTDHVFASGNNGAVLTPIAIYFFILDVHMPCMFNTYIS
jgi:hypothetical protein